MTTQHNILGEIFQEYHPQSELNQETLELESIIDRLKALYNKVPASIKEKVKKGIAIGSIIGKLVSPGGVPTKPNAPTIPEKTYADYQRVEDKRRKDQIQNNGSSQTSSGGSNEFEGTILGEILGENAVSHELQEYENIMAEMQEIYETIQESYGKSSILAEIMLEEEVGTSTSQWRKRAAVIITGKANHPLKFLLKKDGTLKSPRLTMAQLQADPTIVEMGHIKAKSKGGDKIMLQSAYLNQFHKSKGQFQAIDIEGVATDLASAKVWVKKGLLNEKWLKSPAVVL
jgi:hypothetical protein